MIPDDRVLELQRVVVLDVRSYVCQTAVVAEGKIGQSPVQRILGDARNSQVAGDVVDSGEEVCGVDLRAIERYAKIVG